MKKNKKLTYLLIALTVTIWGLVGFRIYSNFKGESRVNNFVIPKVISFEVKEHDSIYTLSLDYSDPFLKGEKRVAEETTKNPVPPAIINWPTLEYRGCLTNQNKAITGLLKIGNSNLLINKGKIYSNIKIVEILKDSVLLACQDKSRWIKRLK